MPRLPRFDHVGAWFHVLNRGLARRAVFETRADVRYFLSRLAYAVRRGELEVHAFCLMTTHYHLLVRSPAGRLSDAMRRVQNEYVRYFNRTRRRDGPLFRGRFVSKPVRSTTYRRILVRYIDQNPVRARLAPTPGAYPHGSAARFLSDRVPPWLSDDWVLQGFDAASAGDLAGAYATRWGQPVTRAEQELVEVRLQGRGLEDDDLDDLVGAAPPAVRAWMVRKARLADATRPGLACVPPRVVEEVVDDLRHRGRRWTYRSPRGQRRDAWAIARTGLLRHLAGQALEEIAGRLEVARSLVTRRLRAHAALLDEAQYATRMGRVATLCVAAAFRHRGKVPNQS